MKTRRLQCKDIPDRPVLAFLATLGRWATWYGPYVDLGPLPDNSVRHAMPPATPGKLALAKMRMLIRSGLVDGCPCGCRGDFEITEKGRAFLDGPVQQPRLTKKQFLDMMKSPAADPTALADLLSRPKA